jgi:hypothetical protein
MRVLAKVAYVFRIPGRGLIPLPEDPKREYEIRAGIPIQLRTPDGRAVDTHIAAIDMACGPDGCAIAIMLPHDLPSENIPPGTETWYVPENTKEVTGDAPAAPAS